MSSNFVRRLTATVALAALLCLAAPAVAAPPSRSHSPVVLGPSFLDQVVAWLARLWVGDRPDGQSPLEKKESSLPPQPESDGHGMIDPNGAW